MSEEPLGPRRAYPEPRHALMPTEPALDRPRRAVVDDDESDIVPVGVPRRAQRGAVTPSRERGASPLLVILVTGVLMVALVFGLYSFYGVNSPTATPSFAHTHSSDPISPSSTSPSPSASASQSAAPAGKPEVVDDATVTVPLHWEVYHDQQIEDDRRLIRVRDRQEDVRLQVATLTSVGSELRDACQALVDDQSKEYAVDHQISPRPITVTGEAVGVTCGYVGQRKDQHTDTSVTFTMIQRKSDTHTLVLRVMRPRMLGADSTAQREVTLMTCEAARSFGHALPLC